MNVTILSGRLTKDPELKTTQSNIPVVTFTLAVDKQYKDENGEKQADFISCVAWRAQAELLAKYKHKGDMVGITGKLSTRQYDVDGSTKYVTEVVCDQIEFLESKKEEKKEEPQKNGYVKMKDIPTPSPDEDLPF